MEDKRVADYFVVAGLPKYLEPLENVNGERTPLKTTCGQPPITDITVIFKSHSEYPPEGFTCIDKTTTGFVADLNHGSLRSPEVFLCYRRGWAKPPLVDIGVLYEGRERIMADSHILHSTPYGRAANVNNSGARTFLTFRRAPETAPCNELVVTDICVILVNKGETPPHSYCMIGKNLNKGVLGSDVYICYKKSMNRPTSLVYKPGILFRYPQTDLVSFPLPESVGLFCLPMGATVECWPKKAQHPDPVFSTFVLTVADEVEKIEKVYGAAITFYEYYPTAQLNADQWKIFGKENIGDVGEYEDEKDFKLCYTHRSICILSHWPFFETFEKFLRYIHSLIVSGSCGMPVERYISHFMNEIPFPSPQRPCILVQLNLDTRLCLYHPEDSPLPLSSGGFFRTLLQNLGPDNCMAVLLFAITEQKILFHSLRPDVLTAVAEAVSRMIFPFHWQCPYIPLCPLGLSEVLAAPLPFLVGIDSTYFDLFEPPEDVNCIDVDTNAINIPDERKAVNTKLLPRKPAKYLKNTLQSLYERIHAMTFDQSNKVAHDSDDVEMEFRAKRKEQRLELEIQEAFLRFMATILQGYGSYLLPITKAPNASTTDPTSLFDHQGFIRSRDKSHQKFYTMLMKTQLFIRFIEERSFVSTKDISLVFFDDCTKKISDDMPHQKLLDLESPVSERTVVVSPPEHPEQDPSKAHCYSYQDSTVLEIQLFQSNVELHRQRAPRKHTYQAPVSPLVRRTKHEIKMAHKLARKYAERPFTWSKYLRSCCFSVWFIHLPYFVLASHNKNTVLRFAYELVTQINRVQLKLIDEVCYRVMMQLCCLYSQPVLAVKILFEMKRAGVQPNAITYGYYNKAVLDSEWPNEHQHTSSVMWKKLRNVIHAVSGFRKNGKIASSRKGSLAVEELPKVSNQTPSSHKTDPINEVPISRKNSCSKILHFGDVDFTHSDEFRSQVGSIVRISSVKNLCNLQGNPSVNSTAGLLITSHIEDIDENTELGSAKVNSQKWGKKAPKEFGLRSYSLGFGMCSRNELKRDLLQLKLELDRQVTENSPVAENLNITSFGNDVNILSHLSQVRQRCSSSIPSVRSQESISESIPDVSSLGGSMLSLASQDKSSADVLSIDSSRTEPPQDKPPRTLPTSQSFSFERFNRLRRSLTRPVLGDTDKKVGRFFSSSVDRVKEEKSPEIVPSSPKKGGLIAQITAKVQRGLEFLEKTDAKPVRSMEELPKKAGGVPNATGEEGDIDVNPGPAAELDLMSHIDVITSEDADRTGPNSDLLTPDHGSEEATTSQYETCSDSPGDNALYLSPSSELVLPPDKSPCSPYRTPVTENDPLGALKPISVQFDPLTSCEQNEASRENSISSSLISNVGSRESSVDPNLSSISTGRVSPPFETELFQDFDDDDDFDDRESSDSDVVKDGGMSKKGAQTAVRGHSRLTAHPVKLDRISLESPRKQKSNSSSVVPSLSSIGASLKNLPFSPTGMISPLKSQEILSSSISNLKNMASSIYKKMDELKEVISVNNTPIKQTSSSSRSLYDTGEFSNLEPRKDSLDFLSVPEEQLFPSDILRDTCYDDSEIFHLLSKSASFDAFNKSLCDDFQGLSLGSQDKELPVAVELVLTSCSRCQRCGGILYDEDIMAGWTHEDSNLNTRCPFCLFVSVPCLTVTVKDYRYTTYDEGNSRFDLAASNESLRIVKPWGIKTPSKSGSLERNIGINCDDLKEFSRSVDNLIDVETDQPTSLGVLDKKFDVDTKEEIHDPISVPYLSPLVLRKELENVLLHEGDTCISKSNFVDDHPIIYWNLLWCFQRIGLRSHLPGLVLHSSSFKQSRPVHPSWVRASFKHVFVRTMWDNPKFHEDVGLPLYVRLGQRDEPSPLVDALIGDESFTYKSLINQILSKVQCNDIEGCVLLLTRGMSKKHLSLDFNKVVGKKYHSVYRELLFLSVVGLGRDSIDLVNFDKEYRRAYEKLEHKRILRKLDRPPSFATIFCRRFFRHLDL